MDTNPGAFGSFLQKKRIESKITLRNLAEQIDFSAPYISDVEKGHRNPPSLGKLNQIADILQLSNEDRNTMFDLAGQARDSVAPDICEYIMSRNYVVTALRTARDLDAGEDEWKWFIEELLKRKKRKKG